MCKIKCRKFELVAGSPDGYLAIFKIKREEIKRKCDKPRRFRYATKKSKN